ncbi:MAG: carbohydrate porin [Deltaproteobacteria bacterium]|nr:carbohydrate porin [Deltaproteobacteria bacterium]
MRWFVAAALLPASAAALADTPPVPVPSAPAASWKYFHAGAALPADWSPPGPGRWSTDHASPYYPPDGVQSPLRADGLHLGGDFWIDTGYEKSRRELPSEPDLEFWLMKGRLMLDVTAVKTWKRFFTQAKGQVLAHVEEIPGDEFVNTDDAWIRFGMWDLWDFQVGRFEAWEVFTKGEGFERDTLEDLGAFGGPDIYEVNYAFYRQDGFGQMAFHAYPWKFLRFEVSGVFGNELGFNSIGVRPAGILDFGWIKVKAAGEYRRLRNQEEGKKQWEEKRGLGGGVILAFEDPAKPFRVRFGASAAYGMIDKVDAFEKVDERGSTDTFSAGGFANVGLWSAVLGLGYDRTIQGDRQLNDRTGRVGHFVHDQLFVSVRHPVVIPNLTAKLVFAWARADLEPAFDNPRVNDMYSVRLRLHMAF